MPYLIYNIHVSRLLVDRKNSYNREASDGSGTARARRGWEDLRNSVTCVTRLEKAFLVRKKRDELTDTDRNRAVTSLTCHNLPDSCSINLNNALEYYITL